MKITDSEVINDGEKELIDAITGDLDWSTIEKIFREHHKLAIGEDVEYKQGDIVVHESQIAYKLEFEVKVVLSVLMDREGNYIAVTSSRDLDIIQDENGDGISEEPEKIENESPERSESDPETNNGTMEDAHTNLGQEKPMTDDYTAKSEDGYEKVLVELDPSETHEKTDMMPSTSPEEDSRDLDRIQDENGDGIPKEPEKIENESPERSESDPEANNGTMKDAHTDLEPEKPMTDDYTEKSEDGYEKVLVELDPSETHEKTDMTPSTSPEEDSRERISRTASEAREMMAELVEGS